MRSGKPSGAPFERRADDHQQALRGLLEPGALTNPKAVCVLPVPDGPRAMQFWHFSIHSQRISPRTSALFSDGSAANSNASKLFF